MKKSGGLGSRRPLFLWAWIVGAVLLTTAAFGGVVLVIGFYSAVARSGTGAGSGTGEMIESGHGTTSREDDTELVNAMRDRGDDLAKARSVAYYLYVPKHGDAGVVAKDLNRLGYVCEIRMPLGELSDGTRSDDWLVYATNTHVVSVQYLQRVEHQFTIELRRFHGTYDGWEVNENRS